MSQSKQVPLGTQGFKDRKNLNLGEMESFKASAGRVVLGKLSSTALLLAPKLLRPGKMLAATVKDSPQSAFPTSPLTVWYRESVRFAVRLP